LTNADEINPTIPNPPTISMMVNARPAGDSGYSSPNPTVVSVMTVIYSESITDQLSIKWYPSVPPMTITSSNPSVNSIRRCRNCSFSKLISAW